MAGFRDNPEGYTSSTLFLLNGVGLKVSKVKPIGFKNAYIDDIDHEPHYKNSLYVLFKPNDMDDFGFFISQEQSRTPLIVEDYDYEGGYVVLVYMFPDQYLQEYQYFLTGDFSMFRKSYTKLFPDDVIYRGSHGMGATTIKTIQYHVFNRTKELKEYWEDEIGEQLDEDMEYWSAPDIEKETLNIEKIKQAETANSEYEK